MMRDVTNFGICFVQLFFSKFNRFEMIFLNACNIYCGFFAPGHLYEAEITNFVTETKRFNPDFLFENIL